MIVRRLNTASVAFLIASSALFWGQGEALTPSSGNRPGANNDRSANRRLRPRPVSVSRVEEQTTRQGFSASSQSNQRSPAGATSIEDISNLTPVQVERLIIKLGRKGRIDQALEVYNSIPKPVVRQVNAVVDACSRARPVRLDLAFQILKDSPVPPNVYTFGSLMSVCAREGSVGDAVKLLKSMEEEYGVAPNSVVYNTAVSACGRADPPQPAMALKLLQEASDRGVRMSAVGYNAAISAAAHADDWQGAADLLAKMEKGDDDGMVPRPDAVSYGTVLSAFERGQEWRRLLEYADYMQSIGIKLDALAITSVLHACQSLGLADEAIRYLNMMKESDFLNHNRQTAGWKRPGGRKYFDGPDAVAYLLAVSACARGGAWLKGIELLDEYCKDESVRDAAVDVSIFTAAIKGCEYEGRWEEAFIVLERMRKCQVEPNERAFAAVIGACATACSKIKASQSTDETVEAGPLNKALRLLNVMRKDESVLSPTSLVFNAAIRTCAEAHDVNRALKLYDAMQLDNVAPNVFTFGALMTACERMGNTENLNKVFSLMKQAELSATNVIYGAAISCCRKAGEEERALLLLRKMVQDGLKPNVATFNTVLMAQAESRNMENVARVYKFMTSEDERPAEPNRQTFNIIIRAFADQKQPTEAESVLRHMRSAGFVPDVDLYTLVVSAYERVGQPLQALRLMESMNAEGYAFYEDKVLNAAFKRAVKVANSVGRRWSTADGELPQSALDSEGLDADKDEFFCKQ